MESYGGLDVNGNTRRPSYIGLGHEMGHGADSDLGLLYPKGDANGYVDTYNGVLKCEWNAVYTENMIRSQAKLPLRAYYGIENPIPTGEERLIDSKNNPIKYPR